MCWESVLNWSYHPLIVTGKQTRKRNEALDNFAYALAAVYILQPNFEKLAKVEPQQQKQQNIQRKPSIIQERRRLYRTNPRNFVNSWKE